MTELTLPIMDADYARRLTERIRLTATNARESLTKLQGLVEEAQQGQAHIALGYKSWQAYIADVFGDEPMQLRTPEDRREIVQWLTAEGMSPNAIAPVVGVTRRRVSQIRAAAEGGSDFHPDTQPIDLASVDMTTGEIHDEPIRPTVTGMDGKTYTRPAPAAPRRRALADTARDVGQDLRKVTERLERIAADDRFAHNKDEVAAHLRHHLARAIQVCQDLDHRINN